MKERTFSFDTASRPMVGSSRNSTLGPWRRGLQYRAAALAGMSTQLVWGVMEVLLYRAFWLEHPERFPMGFS